MSFADAIEALAHLPIKGTMPTAGEVSAIGALSAKWSLQPGATVVLSDAVGGALAGTAAVYVGEDAASGRSLVRLCAGDTLVQVG
jgi:hypothetical protein